MICVCVFVRYPDLRLWHHITGSLPTSVYIWLFINYAFVELLRLEELGKTTKPV